MNILAIDDVHDNLLTLKALLRAFLPEAHLKTAISATEGIKIANNDQPDVILLDIQMPVMDGYETTKRLKNDPNTQHIPIILITAHFDNSSCKIKGLDYGADAFISKPIEEAELVAQIRAMYRIKRSEDALRSERHNLELLVAERIEEIYEKQRLNQLLLDAIPHSTYLINRDKKIISYNKMASNLGAHIGDYCWFCIHKPIAISNEQSDYFLKIGEPSPDTKCSFCRADEAMIVQKPIYAEIEHSGAYWDIWWIPVNDSMYLHYMVDITARKIAEQERQSLEKQLFHAQKLESIGTLAGGIAHDFNNILTVISGYSTLLRRELEGDRDKLAMVNEILNSSDRAAEMTSSLLMFSSKQTLELEPHDLNQIITELSKTLKRLIREDIVISTDITDGELSITADRVQIEQVLINLVVNARDAIPAEGLITLRTELIIVGENDMLAYGVETPGKYALLSLSDTGAGMSSQTLEHIFEPFFTTKELGKGTGLGLSISYSIVKKHNGAILVNSAPGLGTKFTILLPISNQPAKSAQELSKSGLTSGNETILVVEDEEDVRDLIKFILEKSGYNVVTAEDGEAGLSAFINNQHAVKLVISDVVMPKKNGIEMCRAIRMMCINIPIILTSGYTDGLLDKELSADDKMIFIKKPLNPDNLLVLVRRILDAADYT